MSHHYRADHMWQQSDLTKAEIFLKDLHICLARMEVAPTDKVIRELIKAMADDLDSPSALSALQDWIDETNNGATGGSAGELGRAIDAILGIAL
jgi:L-cysteine:1D-myo-inositol 2-amino-2-deoxy-alpha-D-glucopyranoside ligase